MSVKAPESGSKILFPSFLAVIIEVFAVFITGFLVDNWKNAVFSHYNCGFSPPPPMFFTALLTLVGIFLAFYGTRKAYKQKVGQLKVIATSLLFITLIAVFISWAIIGLSQFCVDNV